MSNLAQGKYLNLLLYLEGVQVPVISARIVQKTGGIATADINIIPTMSGLNILPRTNVLLFYYEPRAQKWDNKKRAYVLEDENMRYCVLFFGEVIGHSYSKTDGSRFLTLSCVDHTTYWDVAYAYHFNANSNDPHLLDLIQQKANFLQANVSNPANTSITTLSLGELLLQKPLSPEFQDISGLLGGIIRVIEEMTGVVGSTGVNDFFSYANLRCKLIGQLGAPLNDTNASELFERGQLLDWLNGNILSQESTISLRSIINYVLQYIFYQHSPNMSPYFIPPQSYVRATVNEETDPGLTALVEQLREKGYLLSDYIVANNAAACKDILDSISPWNSNALPVGAVGAQNQGFLGVLGGLLGFTSTTLDNTRIQLHARLLKTTIEAMWSTVNSDPVAWDLMKSYIMTYLSTLDQLVDLKGKKEIINKGDRLLTRIFHPNIFFASPPRCNVIFPEYYNTLNYGRAFLNEATRLQLSTSLSENLGTSGEVVDSFFYAPDLTGNLKPLQGKFTAADSALIRQLQPHERHIGIIPRFASFGERLALWTDQAQEEAKNNGGETLYFQRLANYFFFDDRLGSRYMTLTGKFNPDMVVGFPCLVLDNPIFRPGISSVADVQKHSSEFQQFLAVVVETTHYISQDTGASTQTTLSYIRTHRAEDDEMLRATKKTFRQLDLSKAIKTTLNYAACIANKDISKLSILFDISTSAGKDTVTAATVYGLPVQVPIKAGSVTIGSSGPAAGTIVLLNVTEPEPPQGQDIPSPLSFNSMREKIEYLINNPTITPKEVYSSVDVYEFPADQDLEQVSLPIEEVLRPTWISTIYQNSQIGDNVYTPLFGTGSITDAKNLPDVPSVTFAGNTMVSIENAVDYLTFKYSQSRADKQNNSFAESYTYRPIATFRDIFGDKENPGFATNLLDPSKSIIPAPGKVSLSNPVPCFVQKGIPAELDNRSEKQQRVLDYKQSISNRALRN